MKMKHFNALLLLSGLFAACGDQQPPSSPAELVVAEVGDKSITAAEFAEFSSMIPEGMHQGATPLAVAHNLLNSLIDKELLLQEAQASNIENMIWFIDELTNYERSRILRLYERREIISKLNITEEMVDAHYRATRRDRSIRLGGIMVDTEEEANALHQQLQDGADFHQLARTHSVHRESAERGGDTGLYQLRDQLMPEVAAEVAALEIGEIAPPVPIVRSPRAKVCHLHRARRNPSTTRSLRSSHPRRITHRPAQRALANHARFAAGRVPSATAVAEPRPIGRAH